MLSEWRGFLFTTITFLGQRADMPPAVAVSDTGPDDGTLKFNPPGKRWTALIAYNCALPGNGPCESPIAAP